MPAAYRQTAQGVRLRLRVQPRSARNQVVGLSGEAVKVCVNAPPVGGAANTAVIDVVARWLGLSRSALTLVQGAGARDKVLAIASADAAALCARIEAALAGCVDKQKGGG